MFEYIEISLLTFFLRQGVALVIAANGLVLWMITRELRSERVKALVSKYGTIVLIFAACRVLAAFVDYEYGFGIGLWSNVVNYGFWSWLLFSLVLWLCRLRKGDGREKTADGLEQIAREMRLYKSDLHKFITTGG